MTLIRGEAVPPDGPRLVARHPLAEAVHVAKVELSKSETLVSRAAEPPDGFLAITLDTAPN